MFKHVTLHLQTLVVQSFVLSLSALELLAKQLECQVFIFQIQLIYVFLVCHLLLELHVHINLHLLQLILGLLLLECHWVIISRSVIRLILLRDLTNTPN